MFYAGQEYDTDTGLSYMNARYYNGKTGRFMSQDPIFISVGFDLSDPQSLNSYAYARNNPLRYIDPNGEWFKEVITGKQSWGDFTLEVGEASQYLYENDSTWKTAMDHPYIAGGVIGVGGGLAAAGGAAGLTVLSNTYLQGAGTA